ncbi:hypothetical protein ACFFWD_24825 [Bradyrhizobium erythrophlei]|uniref:hypothetical protein n=1 Tax=Bradyrhizobium erythrophlei TaxID=1437360 RepID=UPI0035EBE69F
MTRPGDPPRHLPALQAPANWVRSQPTIEPGSQGKRMGKAGSKSKGAKTDQDKSKKPPPPPSQDDDDDEDGDIATPKRDRYGNDDEPL